MQYDAFPVEALRVTAREYVPGRVALWLVIRTAGGIETSVAVDDVEGDETVAAYLAEHLTTIARGQIARSDQSLVGLTITLQLAISREET